MSSPFRPHVISCKHRYVVRRAVLKGAIAGPLGYTALAPDGPMALSNRTTEELRENTTMEKQVIGLGAAGAATAQSSVYDEPQVKKTLLAEQKRVPVLSCNECEG